MNDIIGLFKLPPLRSEGIPGSPVLTLDLLVSPPRHQVSGIAEITQATNPPLDIKFNVAGVYSTMTVMPQITHYQIKLEGVVFNPANVTLSETPSENNNIFNALLVLDADWERGEVTYSFNGGAQVHQPIRAVKAAVETTTGSGIRAA